MLCSELGISNPANEDRQIGQVWGYVYEARAYCLDSAARVRVEMTMRVMNKKT